MNKFNVVNHAPQYWINKAGALKMGKELVQRNLKLEGAKLEDYINFNFFELWDHFDVLKNDLVEIERMSGFYKRLLKDFTISLQ